MKRILWLSALLLIAAPAARGTETIIVIGDSLSKEYETEFKLLYPDHPQAWSAQNWAEILHSRRHAHFDLGDWGVFADFRLTGHRFNCAKPGGTTREFRNFLRQDQAAQDEVTASGTGLLLWPQFRGWRTVFNTLTTQADKMVIFLGGNDLALGNSDPLANPYDGDQPREINYETLYDGTFGPASDPNLLRDAIRKNLKSVIQYFRVTPAGWTEPRYAGPIVLVNAPHVGATPKVIADTGTDPDRHAVATTMIERLNAEIRAMAAEFDLGYADIYAMTNQIRLDDTYSIGGIRFHTTPDDTCGPRSLFSGDGFHPNTPAQAKIAQIILDAFRSKYPDTAGKSPALTDREIVKDILKLELDTGFKEWLESHQVPAPQRDPLADSDADGLTHLMEFALAHHQPNGGQDPPLPSAVLEINGSVTSLRLDYSPRFPDNAYCDLVPQRSIDMKSWTDVAPDRLTKNADGSVTVREPWISDTPAFLRLAARVAR